MLRFKGRILCGLSVGGQISDSEADDSVPRAVGSGGLSISSLRKLRSLPLAVLARRSSAHVALFLCRTVIPTTLCPPFLTMYRSLLASPSPPRLPNTTAWRTRSMFVIHQEEFMFKLIRHSLYAVF